MPVRMLLHRIIISEIDEARIDLKEADGDRQFSIMIGSCEAASINRGVKKSPAPRPLTHDLLVNLTDSLGGELDSVVIDELKKGTFYAKLRVKRDGELIEVDSRSSDAIAVAVTCQPQLPIYVSEDVLEEVA